jgi:hypothetical protein
MHARIENRGRLEITVDGFAYSTADVGKDTPVGFQMNQLGTRTYYSYSCEEIRLNNPSAVSLLNFVVNARVFDSGVSSLDAIPTDCAKEVSLTRLNPLWDA